jgi:hypothetical protein
MLKCRVGRAAGRLFVLTTRILCYAVRALPMAHSLSPTPLGLKRRIGLLAARLIMAFFVLLNRLRPAPFWSEEVSHHRYGADPAETLEHIPRKAGTPERAPIVFILRWRDPRIFHHALAASLR